MNDPCSPYYQGFNKGKLCEASVAGCDQWAKGKDPMWRTIAASQ